MSLCGLWHGAQWTFVCWGAWHGIALALQQTWLKALFDNARGVRLCAAWVVTMLVVFAGWLLFRAPTMAIALTHARAVLHFSGGLRPALIRENGVLAIGLISSVSVLIAVTRLLWQPTFQRFWEFEPVRTFVRPAWYAVLLCTVIVLDKEAKAFVYFQF